MERKLSLEGPDFSVDTAVIVTSPQERLDQLASAALVQSIRDHISRGVVNHVLDLRALDEVDPETVRTLIKIERLLREVGGYVSLVIDNPNALRAIKAMALERVFDIHATADAAMAAFEAQEHASISNVYV